MHSVFQCILYYKLDRDERVTVRSRLDSTQTKKTLRISFRDTEPVRRHSASKNAHS